MRLGHKKSPAGCRAFFIHLLSYFNKPSTIPAIGVA